MHQGRLVEIGCDDVGYIDCPDFELLVPFHIADVRVPGGSVLPADRNGLVVQFQVRNSKPFNISISASAQEAMATGAGA